ncbi:MAG: hypothetical protein FWG82_06490 [Oscillospiraceae bacterium]|nr:hypothetical protein [Oscillospiraceae bacterium]
MRHCTVIYNPVASRFDNQLLVAVLERLKDEDFVCTVVKSNRAGAVVPLVKERNEKCDLILTMGGDGTVSEALHGFFGVKQSACYAHLSMGTTNDVGINLGLNPKDPMGSLELILGGEEKSVDFMTVNGNPIFYVSSFGYVTDVPHKTPSYLKRRMGRSAYVAYFLANAWKNLPHRRPIRFIADERTIDTRGVTVIISNSKNFAGVNIHKDADISDGKFELMLLERLNPNLARKIFLDYTKNQIDLKRYSDYIRSMSISELVVEFDNTDWNADLDNDGEEFILPRKNNLRLEYKIGGQLKMLIP